VEPSTLSWALLGATVLALVVLGTLGVQWLRRRRAARAPRRAPRPLRHPVVLAHGILGFDSVEVAGRKHDYFRGVPEQLRQLGCDVHVVRVPPLGSVAERAEALAGAVRSIDARQVNIIAHSMGGLDARYAISRLGLAAKVASLTTIGTPHRGTPLADMGTSLLGDKLGLRRVAEALAVGTEGFYALTTARMASFNSDVPDARGVRYASYVAAFQARGRGLHPLLLPSYLYLARCAGPNDGLVPADSQRWGEVLGSVEADHWAQIGWSSRFDAQAFYASLFDLLRQRDL
jgi:triacylglycerol lipase